jgi:hypothetical protein
MEAEELKEVLRKHGLWVKGETGGVKAYLSGANLSRANLYEANLYRADLCGAYLYEADLSRANLCGANLCGANLYEANLYEAIGNNREVLSMQIGVFPICITKDVLFVGCKKWDKDTAFKIKYRDVKDLIKKEDFTYLKKVLTTVLKSFWKKEAK